MTQEPQPEVDAEKLLEELQEYRKLGDIIAKFISEFTKWAEDISDTRS